MVKPWPFRAWALDVIGKIHPTSSKQHSFILVATDYFTKWVEAVPLKNATQKEVIEFVLNHIVYRFGIPHTLTTDQGLKFTGEKSVEFLDEFNIKLHHSSPYYPQANGLAEAANKIVIGIIRKMLTFGQDAVLPAEFVVSSPRVASTTACIDEAYAQRMWQQLEEVDTDRLNALDQVVRQSEIREKYYGKRVSPRFT
ncbi:uncharacterized protein LOC127256251 [Andrographis paniculata]|uniref:uncharacterized protein LOC127256251 n=1 Tax=Andrographis paniculata TaxID=175694 RepID=UPI0021E7B9A1|nr:uncharacterized protein LOC127256251 [Andrographis paniculata]